MLINDWDIGLANARQWNVIPGYCDISNNSEWARGSPIPVFFSNQIGFKPLKVVLLIKGAGRQEILENCSTVLAHLLDPALLTLEKFDHKFYGILKKHSFTENPMNITFVDHNRAAKMELEFSVYECGDLITQTFTGLKTFIVNNPGNIRSPAIIEITPQIGAASIELTGICQDPNTKKDLPVAIRKLTAEKKVILNGETGLITEDGALKAGDADIWELPTLLPGENQITVTSDRMEIVVKFHPFYM